MKKSAFFSPTHPAQLPFRYRKTLLSLSMLLFGANAFHSPSARAAGAGPTLETQEVAIWPLSFLPTKVTSTFESKDGTPTPAPDDEAKNDAIDELVTVLNNMFPSHSSGGAAAGGAAGATDAAKDTPSQTVHRRGKYLLLSGTKGDIIKIKQILAEVDSPWPQVQLNVWAFQASGSNRSVSGAFNQMTDRIRSSKANLQACQGALHLALEQNHHIPADLEKALKTAGFDPDPNRPLSLNEMIVLFSIVNYDDQVAIVHSLQKTANRLIPPGAPKNVKYTDAGQSLVMFHHVAQLYLEQKDAYVGATVAPDAPDDQGTGVIRVDAVRNGIEKFLIAAYEMNELKKAEDALAANPPDPNNPNDPLTLKVLKYEDAPEKMRVESATADRMLNLGMEAFTSDMHEMFLDPMVEDYSRKASGVEMVGRTHMVVTSGLETSLKPTATSYVDTTIPAPIGVDTITSALKSDGLASVLPSYSGSQVLGLATLLSQPEPQYTKVSPGIELHVRPSVMPDSGSARLQLSASFGVATEIQARDANAKGTISEGVLAPGIATHHVDTDATVTGYDLFDLSSFTLESKYPRSKYLPIIGSIPILRDIITRTPKLSETEYQSMLLVNAVIVPRSYDIARFYSGTGEGGSVDSTQATLNALVTPQTPQ